MEAELVFDFRIAAWDDGVDFVAGRELLDEARAESLGIFFCSGGIFPRENQLNEVTKRWKLERAAGFDFFGVKSGIIEGCGLKKDGM